MDKQEMIARMEARSNTTPTVNNIDDALEERRQDRPEESQTEKSRRAVMDEIRELLSTHPELSKKDIALRVGATPKQVGAQRYLMSDKGKAQQSASYERVKAARTPQDAPKAETPEHTQEAETPKLGQPEQPQTRFEQYAPDMAAKTLEKALKAVGRKVLSLSVTVMPVWMKLEALLDEEGQDDEA